MIGNASPATSSTERRSLELLLELEFELLVTATRRGQQHSIIVVDLVAVGGGHCDTGDPSWAGRDNFHSLKQFIQ